jgi:hypothetical protein
MAEPAEDVRGTDRSEGVTDRVNQPVDGPRRRGAQPRLELAEQLLDRVEVRAVRRQVADLGPGLTDQPGHLRRLMAGQVVHHDDVAGAQGRRQAFTDVRLEAFGIRRPVEGQARTLQHAPEPNCGGQSEDLPMAVRHWAVYPFATGGAAVGTVHRRSRPALVDEHQAGRVDCGKLRTPGGPLGDQVRTVLLGRTPRLFFRVIPSRTSARYTTDGPHATPVAAANS